MTGAINRKKKQSIPSNIGIESVRDSSTPEFQSLSDVTELFTDALKILEADNQRLSEELYRSESALKKFSTRNAQQKWSVEESIGFTEALKLNTSVMAQEIIAVKETVDFKECGAYDGSFIWKITNIREKTRKML